MIIRQISIPFDTRKKHGICNISILSKDEFFSLARRVDSISHTILKQSKPIISLLHSNSYLVLPNGITLDQLLNAKDGGLKIVCENNNLWLGFIPFIGLSEKCIHTHNNLGKGPFIHYRLNDFVKLQRMNVKRNYCSLFSLPSVARLHTEASNQLCSIQKISFLLIFNCKETRGALVCCEGTLPALSLIPIFCSRQIEIKENVQNIQLIQSGSINLPFLMGKQSGMFHFPIWSLNQWNREIRKSSTAEVLSVKENIKHITQSLLIAFPQGVSFDRDQGLKGINCAFFYSPPHWRIVFFPKEKSDKACYKHFIMCFHILIEPLLDLSQHHYIDGRNFSSIIFSTDATVMRNKDSKNFDFMGYSLFLLISEDSGTCGLLCIKGNFELKCARPSLPKEGIFPIEICLEQSPSEEPPEKKSRVEEGGETSQKAVEESRQVIEARREEEARRECVNALFFLAQQEQPF